jgi:uncharacterized protein (TIGR02145 family)
MKIGTVVFRSTMAFLALIIFLTSSCKKKSDDDSGATQAVTVTDIDGNVYKTVKIGNQLWMAENLKTTRYRNGDPIPNVADNTEWENLTTGAYSTYNLSYGRLYNWYAVSDGRNVCPAGWHIPSKTEWEQLSSFLGGTAVAGGKMKEAGYSHWNSPNTGATNESGFTALGGGARSSNGLFNNFGYTALWWCSTPDLSKYAWAWFVNSDNTSLNTGVDYNTGGYALRCLKD